MGRSSSLCWPLFATGLLAALGGCAENSFVVKGQMEKLQQQQLAMSRQVQELQSRAGSLDRDNQELGAMLAQARQRSKVLEDQLAVTRDQLTSVTSQLAQVRDEKTSLEQKAQTLTASMHRQGGVTIQPNNSLLENMPVLNQPGVQVRRDGDVVRVELAGSSLFDENTSRLRPGAAKLLADAAAELSRLYPEQRIGIEGHSDSDGSSSSSSSNNYRAQQQLALGRATAVYDVLTTQSRLQPRQLFITGHGANHPLASNATPSGRARNRRVELVVYPDRVAR